MSTQTKFITIQGERLIVDNGEQVAAAEVALWEAGEHIAQIHIAFDGDFSDTVPTPDVIASAWFRSEAYQALKG